MASILTTTKKILGLEADYTAFDLDVTTHINAALSTLDQVGVGPVGGFFIEDATEQWEDLGVADNQLNLLKSYIYLKVRMLFDPPSTSFHVTAMENQLNELLWRLNMNYELTVPPIVPPEVVEVIP